MKKLIALIMVMVMCLALVSCGSTENDTNPNTSDGSVDPLTIKFSSTFQQMETGGMIQQYFADQVAELSGGAMTVDITWGGTLFDSAGELDAVIDGVVDMIALGHLPHVDTLPYLSFPGFAPGGSQAAVDYFNALIFEDAETSALIQGEAEAQGIKYLNVIAGGANAFCTKYAFTDLDTLISGSSSFGNIDVPIFESLGLQVSPVLPPDVYDALSRGLIDGTSMAISPMVMMAWFEVADNWALDGTYSAGNMFTVNLDWWDSLTAEQQDIIQKAADAAEAYSVTANDDAIANDIAAVEAATGNAFVELSADDIARYWAACFEAKAADAMNRANTHNCVDGMTTILEKAAELTSYNWTK